MIKVNLLDSVTDRTHSVAAVEAQVANPRARTWLLVVSVVSLTLLGMGFDWFSAQTAYASAQADLKREEEVAARTEAINKEQAELEKKIKEIQVRIDAIKRLRASQQGPVSVLSAINERIPNVPDFRLVSIEQKADGLVIEGHSPNESAVTQFGRSLEFSGGTFSNVSIETERKEVKLDTEAIKDAGDIDKDAPKPETVHFKLSCKYAPAGGGASAPQADAKDAKKPSAPAPKEIAKN
jgi:Tfp pilus assembly protein PilN